MKRKVVTKREVLDFASELFEVSIPQFHYAIKRIQQRKQLLICKLKEECGIIDENDTGMGGNMNDIECENILELLAHLNRDFHGFTKKIVVDFILNDKIIFENCIDVLNIYLFLVCCS